MVKTKTKKTNQHKTSQNKNNQILELVQLIEEGFQRGDYVGAAKALNHFKSLDSSNTKYLEGKVNTILTPQRKRELEKLVPEGHPLDYRNDFLNLSIDKYHYIAFAFLALMIFLLALFAYSFKLPV